MLVVQGVGQGGRVVFCSTGFYIDNVSTHILEKSTNTMVDATPATEELTARDNIHRAPRGCTRWSRGRDRGVYRHTRWDIITVIRTWHA